MRTFYLCPVFSLLFSCFSLLFYHLFSGSPAARKTGFYDTDKTIIKPLPPPKNTKKYTQKTPDAVSLASRLILLPSEWSTPFSNIMSITYGLKSSDIHSELIHKHPDNAAFSFFLYSFILKSQSWLGALKQTFHKNVRSASKQQPDY